MRCLLACLLLLIGVSAGADEVRLRAADLFSLGAMGWIAPTIQRPAPDSSQPLLGPAANGPAAGMLRRLELQGRISGLDGVLYDNRDRGHSQLPSGLFPALATLTYDPELQKADLDHGLGGAILFPMITVGNASLAITKGEVPRSLPRLAMTTKTGPARAFRTYSNNHLYVYPEHLDHDEQDIFPANWPYMTITQGSSGSDQPFLRALLMTLAAFPPKTRARLEEQKLVAPVLQMILRYSQKGIYGRDAYLSGKAHPTVFNAENLLPERMVSRAAALLPADIPPMVQLRVLKEDFSQAAGLAGLPEELFTTPSAVARVWRSFAHTREIVLSTDLTRNPTDRDLTFHWVLLRGDPSKVVITPLDPAGRTARIRVDWHDMRPIAPRDPRSSARVDVGVIAWNGVQFSAPAILSVSFPVHQTRRYSKQAGNEARLLFVDYDAINQGAAYDPTLHWSAPWSDTMHYDAGGALAGWRRQMTSGEILEMDTQGRTQDGRTMVHRIGGSPDRPVLEMVSDPAD